MCFDEWVKEKHMNSLTRTSTKVYTGRAITALPVVFLLFDGVIKLLEIRPVVDSFIRLGYDPAIAVPVGALELACVAIYLIPRTSIAGAVLLTGFLGGAVSTHLRLGDPILTHVMFPAYVGLLLWTGLLLRDSRLRPSMFFSTTPAY
jgi:hypothetical protein